LRDEDQIIKPIISWCSERPLSFFRIIINEIYHVSKKIRRIIRRKRNKNHFVRILIGFDILKVKAGLKGYNL